VDLAETLITSARRPGKTRAGQGRQGGAWLWEPIKICMGEQDLKLPGALSFLVSLALCVQPGSEKLLSMTPAQSP